MNNENLHTEKIKAYLAGRLTAKEMHAFEKQALDDPFMAEAMDGLLQNPESSIAVLNDLKGKLAAKNKVKKTKWLRYLPAAAAVLAAMAFGLFFILQNNNQKAGTITKTVIQSAAPSLPKEAASTDTEAVAVVKNKDTAVLKRSKTVRKDKHKGLVRPSVAALRDTNAVAISDVKAAYLQRAASPAQRIDTQVPNKRMSVASLLQGKVAGLNIQGENIEKRNADLGKRTDSNKAKYLAKNKKSSNVLGYQPSSDAKTRLDSLGALQAAYNIAKPIQGWDVFQQYLQKEIQHKFRRGKKGVVVLRFEIMPDSSIKNIEILQGVNAKRNRQAILLLQNGPKWIGSFDKSHKAIGKCKISFP